MAGPLTLAPFPYGAVYFRKSNPPREDWARDYATAAQDGLNTFRHWFLWSAIETAPNTFDWSDYDAQLDLAARHGLKTVIAEFVTAAPEWAWRQLAHARYEAADGRRAHSSVSPSCAVGGFPGLCLDNDDARELAARFLTRLVERYRDHAGLGAYDVWNECNIPRQYCFCPGTASAFRDWLRVKYVELGALAEAWHRHSYTCWEDVEPPRDFSGYSESLDWLQFRIDNAYGRLRWRVELIRGLDPHHPVTAHGVAQTLTDHGPSANDEWRSAAEVDSYGFTWIAARRGDEPWKHLHAVDLVRAGARGKPFWHAEAQAGPLWLQPQVAGRPRDDGRVASPDDIRYWSLTSFAGGATGWLCPRWRPLLDGPLFGAFGMYGMDGARTDRSAIVSRLAAWSGGAEQSALWSARPVRGEVAILFVPESNLFAFVQQGHTDWYAESVRGAYQAFLDLGVQPDFLHIDDLLESEYTFCYLPYPLHLRSSSARTLREWVDRGGRLVSEGCPGYFGDHAHSAPRQPAAGLDELFGIQQRDVEFMPDISHGLEFTVDGLASPVPGALFSQTYLATAARVVGRRGEAPIVVDNVFGRGRTRLIGTFPGAARSRVLSSPPITLPAGTTFTTHRVAHVSAAPAEGRLAASRAFYADLLRWAEVTPHVQLDTPDVIARLHHDADRQQLFLWLLNPGRSAKSVEVRLSSRWGSVSSAAVLWPVDSSACSEPKLRFTVAARDAVVVRLDGSRAP